LADLTIYRFVLQIPFRQFRPMVNVVADWPAISAKNKRETDKCGSVVDRDDKRNAFAS
jgi:hypothetical protein